jgi:hypothetical protein
MRRRWRDPQFELGSANRISQFAPARHDQQWRAVCSQPDRGRSTG